MLLSLRPSVSKYLGKAALGNLGYRSRDRDKDFSPTGVFYKNELCKHARKNKNITPIYLKSKLAIEITSESQTKIWCIFCACETVSHHPNLLAS